MTLEIVLAQPEDLAQIVAIYNQTIASRMVTADTQPVSVSERVAWFESHSRERPLFVAKQAERVLGWCSFKSFYGRPAYAGTCEIAIYIDEAARGQGLGKTLLRYAEGYANEIGVHTLLAFIFSHNLPSLALFKQFGFEQYGELPEVAIMDETAYSLTILGKKV